MTPSMAAKSKSLRGHRIYQSADRVLAVYYALRMDWLGQSAQSDGSHISTSHSGGVPSSAVSFMCDVGSVIESSLSRYEREEVLPRRWHAYFRWQFAVGEEQRVRRGLCRCGERQLSDKLARQMRTILKWERESWEYECDRLSRRKAYRTAMQKVDTELKARDLYARAAVGKWAGIPSPPEWTV